MPKAQRLLPAEGVESLILFVRGHKAILDRDLAELYGVETRVLNQAVKRNRKRFPPDFMFPVTREDITIRDYAYALYSEAHNILYVTVAT